MSSDYANPAALVTTEWVAEHRNDSDVRLIEVDVDTSAYDSGHIPGAVAFNWTTELSDRVRRDIPSKPAWEALLSRAGVTPETHLVFYGDNNNWFAAYAYWVAKMYGHERVSLMNGGRKKWELEGRELTTDVPSITPTTYKAKVLDQSRRAFQRDVMEYVGAPAGKALVDVRSPAEYNGEVIAPPGMTETAQRAGHIPGAQNIPWAQAVAEDGTFKPAEQLRELYASKGITPEKDVIAYCRIGERSSHTWFVLSELLGFPRVRNYDGSWTEWGSMIGAPIENPAIES
ncbi:MAG: sulfurtransferase [Dehalococcoidia bacterium]|nr:MAG: sulfurtransferase [Dehalococcoidia bacterium]